MIRLVPTVLLCCVSFVGCAAGSQSEPGTAGAQAAAPQHDATPLLLRMVDAMGGRAVWAETLAMEFLLAAELSGPEGPRPASSLIVFRMPHEMYRSNVLVGVGEINMLVKLDGVWFQPPDQDSLAPATPAVIEYIRAGLWRDLPFLAGSIARGGVGVTAEHVRDEWIEGLRYQVVAVQPPGDLPGYHLYLDATSGLPLKRVFTQGSAKVEDLFSDFQTEDGRIIPRAIRSYRDGHLAEDIVYTGVRFNTTVSPEPFETG